MKSEPAIRHAIGVDFGGTSVKIGLVSSTGAVLARKKIATGKIAGQEAWLEAVGRAVDDLCAEAKAGRAGLAGVGVGVPGFVDFARGFIYDLTNVPGWTGVYLGKMLEARLGLSVRVDNDVNAMALGECTFGAGREFTDAVFVTLGTGVGGGLLINGKLYRGAFHMAGEIGHVSIDMNGLPSPQGRGGLEHYVGNAHIIERARKALENGRKSAIDELCGGDRSQITPEIIHNAALRGDALGIEIFDFVADCLATAFASVTYLLQPQAFIIGGGVGQNSPVLFDPLRRHLSERLSAYFFDRIQIIPASLGSSAGVIGCAALALLA